MKPINQPFVMEGATERANRLILKFLKAGPGCAREIFAAGKHARISVRTIQRAANALGVEKTKVDFIGGWSWRLPADEGTTTDAPVVQSASRVFKDVVVQARAAPSRAMVIAARLRKFEAGRGRTAPIYAQDRRVIRWVEAGISDPNLSEAYEAAVIAMEGKQDQAMLTVGFLDQFVWDVMMGAA